MLPCSDGERQVLLVAASIAEGIPVDLREAALCMDAVNAARAAQAVCHAAGRRVSGGGGGRPVTAALPGTVVVTRPRHPLDGPGAAGAGRDAPARAAGAAAGAARWQQAADPGGVDQPAR